MFRIYQATEFRKMLDDGQATSRRLGVSMRSVALADGRHALLSPSSWHLVPEWKYDYDCHPAMGWHLGGFAKLTREQRQQLASIAPRDLLPDHGEHWYERTSCFVQASHEIILAIARIAETQKVCVWHAASVYFGHLDTCACAPCEKARRQARQQVRQEAKRNVAV